MYKYDGLVVHESHDDDGILEVVERNGVRSLHFGSYSRQSSIRLDEPDSLVLGYVRAMNAWLLFKESLDEALIVGLGGGSLAKYILHNFPDCKLCAVEYRKSVVKIARSHFGLPLDQRLKIINGDGGHYVRQHSEIQQDKFDLVFLDAFDHDGMALSLQNIAFFDACKTLLKPDGILIINLWTTDKPLLASCVEWMDRVFDSKILFLPVQGKGNTIGFAFNHATPHYSLSDLRTRALALEHDYRMEFPAFLKDICRNNSGTINYVIKK